MKAMLLAAGEGVRLRPLTLDRPKPMLPVAGRPVMEWIVLWLRHHGVRTVAVNLCYKPEVVQAHFGDGRAFGVEMVYSVEEETLGTGGGLKRLESVFDGPFVVAYGDVLTDLNLAALIRFHRAQTSEPHVTLSLYRAPNPWDCGIVAVDSVNRVTRFVEKPAREDIFADFANAGVLVMDPTALEFIPPGRFYDISGDLLPDLLQRGFAVYAQPPDDSAYLLDIGSHEKYAQAQSEWPTPAAAHWDEDLTPGPSASQEEVSRKRPLLTNEVGGGAVFLDRDGVIVQNRADHVKTREEVEFIPGAFEALCRLAEAGIPVVIVTNQGAVRRGLITEAAARELQARIVAEIEAQGGRIAGSYLCPHHPDDGCACRKPAPGMLCQAAEELGFDLGRSILIGDAVTDVQAAHSAGCGAILVRTGRGHKQEPLLSGELCTVMEDLPAAVDWILGRMKAER